MQQHAVPQNVTQYQFRLVGDMTLKQFLELLGGIIGAYLFYSSNLIFIIKWPFAILSILLGFALAFFPIEDRPLDQWIINFLKRIYAPTRYIWKKSNKVPNIFTFEAHPIIEAATATKTVKAPTLTDSKPKESSDVTDEERQRINVLDAMLAKAAPVTPSTPIVHSSSTVEKPAVTVHKLKPFTKLSQNPTIFQSAPRPTPAPKPIVLDTKDISVPASSSTDVPKSTAQQDTQTTKPPEHQVIFANPSIGPKTVVAPSAVPQNIRLPAAPSSPNLIVGMVVDNNNKIIENAIVQIVSGDGVPARAMKTNSLGQFYTSTPLTKGIYNLEVDKEGLTFPVNKLVIEDKIVSPLLLKAN